MAKAEDRMNSSHFFERLRNNRPLVVLFLLFTVMMSLYLHRVPGLMGDEGSEGTNVFELLARDTITVTGERSYISVWIDYVRVPFMQTFGASVVAIRLPVLLASLASFIIGAFVLRRLFGTTAGTFGLVSLFFSPMFLTHQRFGWAISLLPLFAFLALFFFTNKRSLGPLAFGLALGLGLATHLIFLPAAVAIGTCWIVFRLWRPHRLRAILLAVIGFWAMFGMQFAILSLDRDDQGEPAEVIDLASERFRALPSVLPHVLSGSAYVAHYTGHEFSPTLRITILLVLSVGTLLALVFLRQRIATWAWVAGLGIYLVVLVTIIEYFSLRYFALWSLGIWAIAGVGFGALIERLFHSQPILTRWLPVVVAVGRSVFFIIVVLVPFLRTGGSTETFSLGNRRDESSAIVDLRGLLACIQNAGPVFSESIHIRNRLEYLGQTDPTIKLAENARAARWMISYRTKEQSDSEERCLELEHFQVLPIKSKS